MTEILMASYLGFSVATLMVSTAYMVKNAFTAIQTYRPSKAGN